jgi:hypothetical protein
LAALTRSGVGPYRLADALPPEQVTRSALRDPAELIRDLARRELDPGEETAVRHGRAIPGAGGEDDGERVALFANGQLVAVAERVGGVLKPRVVVAEP